MKKTFVYQGPHKVHASWAKAVEAKPIYFRLINASLIKTIERKNCFARVALRSGARFIFKNIFAKSDIVLSEDLAPLPESLILRKKDGKVILIAAAPFFKIGEDALLHVQRNSFKNYILSLLNIKPNKRQELLNLLSQINGVIAVSNMLKKDLESYVKCSIKVVYPYANVNRFLKFKSDLNSFNIVFAGVLEFYKGVDLLLNAFKKVKERFKEAKLFILGEGSLKNWILKQKIKDVYALGYTSKPEEYFKKSCIYVHPARYEAFGVAVIEAMCTGLIPIVTIKNGVKEVVEKVSKELIVEPDELTEKIIKVLSLSIEEKKRLSRQAREEAKKYTKTQSIKNFIEAFNELIN
jgi:glycosyltransferase involved in cell wall biosynthesis